MRQQRPLQGAERRRKQRTLLSLLGELMFLVSGWFAMPPPRRPTPQSNGRRRRERGGRRATDRHALGLGLPPAAASPQQKLHQPSAPAAAASGNRRYRVVRARPRHYPPRTGPTWR